MDSNIKSENLLSLLFRIWNHFSGRRRKQFFAIGLLSIFSSVFEVLSVGAVLPFLAVLTTPEKIFNLAAIQPLLLYMNISNSSQLILPVIILFSIATFISVVGRLLLLWGSNLISYTSGVDLSQMVYQRTLYQPYKVHISRNSSEILSGVEKAKQLVPSVILPVVNTVSSILILFSLFLFFISVDPLVSFFAFFSFGLLYGVIAVFARKRLALISKILSKEHNLSNKSLQEGLGGIRDILLDGTQNVYCEQFENAQRNFSRAVVDSRFTGGSPRFLMEALGMILISAFAYALSLREGGLSYALPFLGSLAIGAQKMLPLLQMGYHSWTTVKASENQIMDVLELLDQPLPGYALLPEPEPMEFKKEIYLNKISFSYSLDGLQVIKDIDFKIKKGSRTGIVGTTGSGKSTLLDIFMGLLEPVSGKIMVDEKVVSFENIRAWQVNIAHVPQAIYLSDSSIAQNIAFGIAESKIDYEKICQAAQQAQIAEYVNTLKDGYNTLVGERGVRLSGGQRQRIGIARALYKNANILVFDEATSALDNDTEKSVMDAIESLGGEITVIMIAHRLSTVRKCDQIIELQNGKIVRKGNYELLFGASKSE